MKGKRERENMLTDEWFIGDEEWDYSGSDTDYGACYIKTGAMTRPPTPYPSYDSFPKTVNDSTFQIFEPAPNMNFCNKFCYWISRLGKNIQILYAKLLFK
uniref:Uncharacterized protein n=1 Tax=viral metagenome TaxID=1070528 RepID=A0A6C0LMU2_9ZZZZ